MFIEISFEMFWAFLCIGNNAKLAAKAFFSYMVDKADMVHKHFVTKKWVVNQKCVFTGLFYIIYD